MSDKRTTLVMMLKDEVSKTAASIDKSLQTTHKGAMGSILAGVGLGAGVSAFGLFTSAVGKAQDALGDAVRAAAEDETSQLRLYTAVEQNAKGWDGNRAAIEAVLKSRMKLAF